jgi:hypothetical protein
VNLSLDTDDVYNSRSVGFSKIVSKAFYSSLPLLFSKYSIKTLIVGLHMSALSSPHLAKTSGFTFWNTFWHTSYCGFF